MFWILYFFVVYLFLIKVISSGLFQKYEGAVSVVSTRVLWRHFSLDAYLMVRFWEEDLFFLRLYCGRSCTRTHGLKRGGGPNLDWKDGFLQVRYISKSTSFYLVVFFKSIQPNINKIFYISNSRPTEMPLFVRNQSRFFLLFSEISFFPFMPI